MAGWIPGDLLHSQIQSLGKIARSMDRELPYQLEACVTSPEEALEAEFRGAHRLELCTRLETEGMTPDTDLVQAVLDRVNIPVRIMVRETVSDFEADDRTMQRMIEAIERCKHFQVDGFVFGILKDQQLDRQGTQTLLEHTFPFRVTLHKALDQSYNWMADIGWLNGQDQVDTILTAGGAAKAMEGVDRIRLMDSVFRGDIMAAGKITPEQLPELHEQLGLRWYHGRAIV